MCSHPLLPKMQHIHPLSAKQLDSLRHEALRIVLMKLSRAEPPFRKGVVEYMLDEDSHMWSMRRSNANFFRIMSVLSDLIAVGKLFDQICNWKTPLTTILIHILFIILVLYPELILLIVFLSLFLVGLWNFTRRPRHPLHMDALFSHAEGAQADELEEFDTFPTSRLADIVSMRYDRLRSTTERIQTVVGNLATQGERFQSLISWSDPIEDYHDIHAFCLITATVLYVSRLWPFLLAFICYEIPGTNTSFLRFPSTSLRGCLHDLNACYKLRSAPSLVPIGNVEHTSMRQAH